MQLFRTQPTPPRPPPAAWMRMVALALFTFASTLAQAQSTDDPGDPPDRVARLSYLAGDLELLPAGASEWSQANVNRPLTRGDRLASGADARAELELDTASIRIDAGTDIGFLQLDDRLSQLELTRGTLNLSVRRLDPGESYEIDTPTVALVVDQPGVFRLDVDDRDGSTRITAIEGQATVYGENNASRLIVGGHRYRFADSSLAQVDDSYVAGADAFDQWCAQRDRRYARSQSRQYVSEDVVGYEDLDAYGQWQGNPDYGQVWYPSDVTSGWAPYSTGHWAYVAPWGWSWVDDAPWGFAPYHYGRWICVRGRWGWIPGPRELRPIYAPALVAFIGGGHWNMSVVDGGPVGWFPLGPGDVYNPWYRVSRGYYRRVNEHNIRWGHRDGWRDHGIARIDEHYRHYHEGHPGPDHSYANRYAPHGITAVSSDTFVRGRRVQGYTLKPNVRNWREAPVLAHGTGLPPRPRTWGHRAPPVGAEFDRTVVAHRMPPAQGRLGGPENVRSLGRTRREDIAGNRPDPRAVRANPLTRLGQPAAVEHAGGYQISTRHAPGTLPVVPRVVRAEELSAVPSSNRPAYRPPRTEARPATLPMPTRIESVRRIPPTDWQGRPATTDARVIHAPTTRPNAIELQRRFGAIGSSRPEPARYDPPPRSFQPTPRPYSPPPQRRGVPPTFPQHEPPRARHEPAPAHNNHTSSRERPGAERFHPH